MNIKTRNEKIKESNLSMQELADKYGISYERIRQIIRNDKERQKKRIVYISREYKENVSRIIESDINKEVHRLSSKGRTKIIIIQKPNYLWLVRRPEAKINHRQSPKRRLKIFPSNLMELKTGL